MIQTAIFKWKRHNLDILRPIHRRISHFEDELPRLEEVTTILEIALWKVRMTVNENINQDRKKKVRIDQLEFLRQL